MFAKRLLYVTDAQLAAYAWRAGRLSTPRPFRSDPDGRAAFAAYLEETPNDPVYILADVIEEDFRAETIPHVLGKDRGALIQRKLLQHFRNTPYRHATVQGRESGGRRDDRILFTALTNDETLKPWLDALAERKAPVVGIYSVPLLSGRLAQRLGLTGSHHLLVTRQALTGLRQSYFQQDQLKFSRLTLLAADESLTPAETIARESGRTQQYLNSLRLLPREESLTVNVIAAAADLPQLRQECRDTAQLRFRFVDLAEVAATLGVKSAAPDLYSELLFLHLLGHGAGPQPYATAAETRGNRLRLTRLTVASLSGLLAAGALTEAGLNLNRAMDYSLQSEQLARQADSLQVRYQTIKNGFPPLPAKAEDMKAAVELVDAISAQKDQPERLLALVSQAVADVPQIRIDRIDWRLSTQPPASTSQQDRAAQGDETKDLPVLGAKNHGLYQIALISGQVAPLQGYREALASVDRLVEALGKEPGIEASAVSLPLDVSSGARLEGKADGGDQAAGFVVRVVMKP